MTKKKPTVEAQVAALTARLEQSETEKGALANLLARHGVAAPIGQLMVGIRNVSNTTVGISRSPMANEPDVQLHAVFGGQYDPASVAAISYVWWQQLRKGPLVGRGIITRDDTVLGTGVSSAPADAEKELAKGHDINVVLDPHAFITGQPETELRDRVKKMTSEETLRRILAAVDEKVKQTQDSIDETDPERASKAVSELPGAYQIAELVAQARLDSMYPDRSGEATRFKRRGEDREE